MGSTPWSPAATDVAGRDGRSCAASRVVVAVHSYIARTPVTGSPWDLSDPTEAPAAYTPWPTSIRITMTLHDPDLRLERGREVQFVINLPDHDR